MDIIAKNITHTYNEGSPFSSAALKGVDLTIREGEFFGIIGHTGSGKSTFVQHLNALIRVYTAEKKYNPKKDKNTEKPVLQIGEFDLTDKKCDFNALRAKVGMVFQYPEYQLFAETVFEDVVFGLRNFAKEKPTKEAEEAAVQQAIEIVGLDYADVKDKSPFDLSGGQKRRVAIAGVIVTHPEILVLDEPAAGLDPIGKREIMELLHKLHRDWCRTIIVVSHDMDEISENCSRVAVFSEGKVFKCCTPQELFRHSEELEALGLDIPLTAKVQRALAERGVEIETDFTRDDFIAKVSALFRKKTDKGDDGSCGKM